ncbi:LytTR family DNA-binding domain-containing protein [Corallococcus sp. BB11-1]|uniref:LytR/AlgR family response regulator transcription factor n=1 Tax=Corallococcus sp. BB11-1 TaxID=2996783 RepID=UPI0010DCF8B2|nr:LytTR family DNA-binding domain-containing protein [Corallococcus sp. BB11-1]MCY1036097.1 LytTR family DNA-binding domain-containing protein [Corallococcus sp. BB11-1]RYZ46367.1 MAG: response regulator transcription factor [Myxococcaceae bacterium]
MSAPLRVLIVDDERLARERLKDLLAEAGDMQLVGECRNGNEAIAAIDAERPDLVLLDVQMPGPDGFGVLRALPPESPPAVIFVTAHRDFAVQAFEANALDYLLKPFDRERFRQSLARARDRRRAVASPLDTELLARLEALTRRPPHEPERYVTRLVARVGWRMRFLQVEDIDYLTAEGNYVSVQVGKQSHLTRETLSALEAKLDPKQFLRAHRSFIVRLDRIEEVEPLPPGEYVFVLRDGTRLTSGRSYRAQVQRALELPT